MSIGGLPALNDGISARCDMYKRLIKKKDVQLVLSQGNNGPGVNTAGDPGVCSHAMAMGAYLSQASMQRELRRRHPVRRQPQLLLVARPARGRRLQAAGSRSGLGGLDHADVAAGRPGSGDVHAAAGLPMFNGTSMASPQGAGAGALLLSGREGDGIRSSRHSSARRSTRRLATSTRTASARSGQRAMQSGSLGPAEDEPGAVDISATVPVNTILSGFLRPARFGTGIYDREGVTAGAPYTRTYTLTRTNGGNNPRTFNLSWVGNDGTFSTAGSVTLPKNVATALEVNINAAVRRALRDPQLRRSVEPGDRVPDDEHGARAVRVQRGNNYSQAVTGSVGRGQQLHYFFRVPAGTPAFKVDLATSASTTPGTGQIRFLRWHPFGLAIDSNAVSECYVPPRPGCAGRRPSRTVTNPQAGVWEVTVDARRTSDADFTPFTLTGTILGATVSPNPDIIPTATIGVPVARSYTLTNVFGAFTGRAVGTALGSARVGPFTIAHLAAAGVHDDDPGRDDLVPGDDRQPVRSGCGPRPVRVPLQPGLRAGRTECRRRLRGVGHADQPDRGDLPRARGRVRRAGGDDVVQATSTSSSRPRRSGRSPSRTRTRSGRPGRPGRCPDRSPPTRRRPPAESSPAMSRSGPTRTSSSAPAR